MENYFKLLLVFMLATMIHARPPALTFHEANPLQLIAEAVGFYNGESHSDAVFKYYKDEYEYKVGPQGQKQANFTIKETLCQKSENLTIESCEFKQEGLEKNCTASKNEQDKTFSVICTSIAEGGPQGQKQANFTIKETLCQKSENLTIESCEFKQEGGPQGQKQANFTIKETLCQKSENLTIESCEFKQKGLEKNCTASKNDQEKTFSVICTSIAEGTKKDAVIGYVESPINQEDDDADEPEDEYSYEDHIITMDENYKTFLDEEDEEAKRIIDAFLASKTENTDDSHLISRTTKRKLMPEQFMPRQFLGRFLCLECFFDVLPRK